MKRLIAILLAAGLASAAFAAQCTVEGLSAE